MPYAYDPNRREEDDPNNPQGPQVAGSGQLYGGAGETVGQGASAKPTDSGRFQNLNSYLDANQNSQFGTQFADKVNTDVNAAGAAQVQGEQAFRDTVDKSVVKQDKGLVDSAISDPYAYLGGAASPDAEKLKGFQSQYNASYGGPSQYSDNQDAYQKAAGATQKAQDVSQAAQSEPGRFALLDNYFGQSSGREGDYNQGQKGLDNLLVQGDQGAQNSLAQARANAQTSAANFEGQKKTASDYAAAGRGQTEATQNYARGALGTDKSGNLAATGAVPDYLKGLDASVTQRQGNARTDYTNLRGALSNTTDASRLTPDQLKLLGMSAYNGVSNAFPSDNAALRTGKNAYFGVDPTQYAHQVSNSDINRGSVQTVEQARRLKALEQLGGLSANVSNYDDAGKYSSGNLAQFDSGQFNTKLANRRNAAQSEFDSLKAGYKGDMEAFNANPRDERFRSLYEGIGASFNATTGSGETEDAAFERFRNEINAARGKRYGTDTATARSKYKL